MALRVRRCRLVVRNDAAARGCTLPAGALPATSYGPCCGRTPKTRGGSATGHGVTISEPLTRLSQSGTATSFARQSETVTPVHQSLEPGRCLSSRSSPLSSFELRTPSRAGRAHRSESARQCLRPRAHRHIAWNSSAPAPCAASWTSAVSLTGRATLPIRRSPRITLGRIRFRGLLGLAAEGEPAPFQGPMRLRMVSACLIHVADTKT